MKTEQNTLRAKVVALEKAEILIAMKQAGWVKARAARILGITQRMLGYKIKKYALQKEVNGQAMDMKSGEFDITQPESDAKMADAKIEKEDLS